MSSMLAESELCGALDRIGGYVSCAVTVWYVLTRLSQAATDTVINIDIRKEGCKSMLIGYNNVWLQQSVALEYCSTF